MVCGPTLLECVEEGVTFPKALGGAGIIPAPFLARGCNGQLCNSTINSACTHVDSNKFFDIFYYVYNPWRSTCFYPRA